MEWQNIVAAIAPTIGTALGGPLGGMAASAVCQALGIEPGSADSEIEKQLLASPDQLAKIREAEIAFQQRLAELNIDLEKIHADDRNSARQREIAVRDVVPGLLAAGVTVGFFGVLAWLLKNGIPVNGGDALLVMLGSLGSAWGGVIAYYFGSSAGSAQKNALMAGMKK